jgi:hypothetical protein
MFKPPLVDLSRLERMADTIAESVKQLKLSIENSSTRLNAAVLREPTLGIAASKSPASAQANFIEANVSVILALYQDLDDRFQDCSAPTIVIADNKKQVYAAVVRTRFSDRLFKTDIINVIEGPNSASDFKALEQLYELSMAAVQRARMMSRNDGGFDDWDDLDLP